MIRILLVDDQALFRSGLKTVLDLEPDMEVVGTAESGEEAMAIVSLLKPDITLMDIRMPGVNGAACVKALKKEHPHGKILMLTTFDDEEYIIEALANGANGYLLKDIEVEKLIEAIRDACSEKMIIPPEVANKLALALTRIQSQSSLTKKLEALSEREKEIARMLVQGFTNKQISNALYISEGTVRNYISTIYEKISIHDRTQAVLYLKENGMG